YDSAQGAEGYYQPFEFSAGVELGEKNNATLALSGKSRPLMLGKDWRPLAFSESLSVDPKDIVFCGYGIEIPAGQAMSDGTLTELYTSYYHGDVEGKWVLMLRFIPEDLEGEKRRTYLRYASLRYKALTAREKGAKGVIFAPGPRSKVKEELVPLTFDASLADSGIAAISVTTEVANELLSSAGKDLSELQETLDSGAMIMAVNLKEASLSAQVEVRQRKETGRNVIGRLAAKDPQAKNRPALLLGAHIDHLGNKPNSSSRALGRELFQIHPGADDNASGIAGLLEIAHYLSDLQQQGKLNLQRDILFAGWSGEELGLLGSAHFARELAKGKTGNADGPLTDHLAANLNMDMIGRLTKTLVLQGVGSSNRWKSEIERRNAPVGLPITLQQDTYLSTDATTFYLRGVPILSAFTGAHEDYHKPSDTADKLNEEDTASIARLMGLITRSLALDPVEPDYIKVAPPKNRGKRSNLRAYLGTIPDYSQDGVEGVRISGVSKGGPAEQAGLQGGDVIIRLKDKDLKNIYDYTYVLEALKIGEETEIVVRRGEKEVSLSITPGSRE
ncbi:MAG: M28 family peptidase, partial [Verrucomicrobiota bacterium]